LPAPRAGTARRARSWRRFATGWVVAVGVVLLSSALAGSLIEATEPGLASAPVPIQLTVPLARVTGDLLALVTVGLLLVGGWRR